MSGWSIVFLWLHVTLRLWNCWYRFKPCYCIVALTETLLHFVSDHPHHFIIYLLPLLSDVCDFRIHITRIFEKNLSTSQPCQRCSGDFQTLWKMFWLFLRVCKAPDLGTILPRSWRQRLYHEILPRSSLHTQDGKYLGKITYLIVLFFWNCTLCM